MDIFEIARELENLTYISDLHDPSRAEKDRLLFKMNAYRSDPQWDDFMMYLNAGKNDDERKFKRSHK